MKEPQESALVRDINLDISSLTFQSEKRCVKTFEVDGNFACSDNMKTDTLEFYRGVYWW